MPRAALVVIIGLAVVFLTSATALIVLAVQRQGSAGHPQPEDPALAALSIPAFRLVDHDNRPVDESLFAGQVTIIDFMFTNCPFICPMMTSTMADVARHLRDTGVRFASFSVDPERDTPERLREYAAQYDADLSRWSFLTGDFETVRRIASDGLQFELSIDTSTPITLRDGSTMSNVVHPGHLILVGPTRKVLGVYRSTDADAVADLERRAREVWSGVEASRRPS